MRWKILDAWQAAAAEVGITQMRSSTGMANSQTSAYFHVNQRRGRRCSMADAFPHPVERRPNLTVYARTQAIRLLLDDRVEAIGASRCWTCPAPRRRPATIKDGACSTSRRPPRVEYQC